MRSSSNPRNVLSKLSNLTAAMAAIDAANPAAAAARREKAQPSTPQNTRRTGETSDFSALAERMQRIRLGTPAVAKLDFGDKERDVAAPSPRRTPLKLVQEQGAAPARNSFKKTASGDARAGGSTPVQAAEEGAIDGTPDGEVCLEECVVSPTEAVEAEVGKAPEESDPTTGNNVTAEDDVTARDDAPAGDDAPAADGATAGSNALAGDDATTGNGATGGDNATTGDDATTGDGAIVGDGAMSGDPTAADVATSADDATAADDTTAADITTAADDATTGTGAGDRVDALDATPQKSQNPLIDEASLHGESAGGKSFDLVEVPEPVEISESVPEPVTGDGHPVLATEKLPLDDTVLMSTPGECPSNVLLDLAEVPVFIPAEDPTNASSPTAAVECPIRTPASESLKPSLDETSAVSLAGECDSNIAVDLSKDPVPEAMPADVSADAVVIGESRNSRLDDALDVEPTIKKNMSPDAVKKPVPESIFGGASPFFVKTPAQAVENPRRDLSLANSLPGESSGAVMLDLAEVPEPVRSVGEGEGEPEFHGPGSAMFGRSEESGLPVEEESGLPVEEEESGSDTPPEFSVVRSTAFSRSGESELTDDLKSSSKEFASAGSVSDATVEVAPADSQNDVVAKDATMVEEVAPKNNLPEISHQIQELSSDSSAGAGVDVAPTVVSIPSVEEIMAKVATDADIAVPDIDTADDATTSSSAPAFAAAMAEVAAEAEGSPKKCSADEVAAFSAVEPIPIVPDSVLCDVAVGPIPAEPSAEDSASAAPDVVVSEAIDSTTAAHIALLVSSYKPSSWRDRVGAMEALSTSFAEEGLDIAAFSPYRVSLVQSVEQHLTELRPSIVSAAYGLLGELFTCGLVSPGDVNEKLFGQVLLVGTGASRSSASAALCATVMFSSSPDSFKAALRVGNHNTAARACFAKGAQFVSGNQQKVDLAISALEALEKMQLDISKPAVTTSSESSVVMACDSNAVAASSALCSPISASRTSRGTVQLSGMKISPPSDHRRRQYTEEDLDETRRTALQTSMLEAKALFATDRAKLNEEKAIAVEENAVMKTRMAALENDRKSLQNALSQYEATMSRMVSRENSTQSASVSLLETERNHLKGELLDGTL